MWIITTRGFYSVVEHREDSNKVMVRARCKEDIDALCELIPDAESFEMQTSDYAWRIVVARAEWIEALIKMSEAVDYDNFKNAVDSPKHHDAYINVWADLLALDDRGNSW